MSWYNNSITEFDAEDFIERLDFCELICKHCEYYKSERCEYYKSAIRPDDADAEETELHPRDYMCPYNELYSSINEAAGRLEDAIWNAAHQPACDALDQLHHLQELDEFFQRVFA